MNGLISLILLFMPAELDADGWSVLTPSADSRMIHVSSSTGNDTNDGLSEAKPLKTIKAARLKMRHGYPDVMSLRSGDTFVEGNITWERGGRSQSEPMVITQYGIGPRPILSNTGFFYWWPNMPASFRLSNLVISGIDFQGVTGGQSKGVLFSGRISDILIENCSFSGFSSGVHIQHQPTQPERNARITIRRNVFFDSTEMGILADKITDLAIEENVFDRNGWGGAGPTVFSHNVYLKECTRTTLTGNIFARGSNFGTKLSSDNPGGFTDFVVDNNLYFDNGLSLDHSAGPSGDIQTTFTHERGLVSRNVFTQLARTFANSVKQDLALYLLNSRNIEYGGNLFVDKQQHANQQIAAWGGHHEGITIRDCTIHNWFKPSDKPATYYLETRADRISGYTLSGNKIDLSDLTYVDSTRTVGSYFASLGGANDALAFLMSARRSQDNWDARYTAAAVNDYLRAGFTPKDVEPEPVPGLEEIQRIRADLDALELILKGKQ